ncbi:hypothetical protein [Nonomuraea sp. NPDC050691]|uniref:hypothetical protein n=1 Tax=Nonomuraea sp. NPDC050691 TaxID=3155661 RepID=UPI0033EE639A
MPVPVVLAAALQFALAATFLVLPVVVLVRGGAAQRAADTEMERQGLPPALLAEHGIRFAEKTGEFALAMAIAASLVALACLNLAGSGTGRVLSWIAEPLVLLAVGFVTGSQVFAERYTVAALARSAAPGARSVDARAVIAAASAAFPSWLRPVVVVRFGLATLGSLLVVVLLALPAAGPHFS